MDEKFKKNISDITNNHYKYLLSLSNVNGVGLGFKYINEINTFEPCIHVLVEKKIDSKYLSQNNLIPKSYMGINTDVIKVGKITSRKDYLPQKIRPLESGYSISCGKGIGSIGCIVTKRRFLLREYFILSNNHVLAFENENPLGTPVYQPSRQYDKDKEMQNVVALLSDFVPIQFTDKDETEENNMPKNLMDCAIAKINSKNFISNNIAKLGKVKGIAEDIILNLSTKKVGKSSGLSTGLIKSIGTSLVVEHGTEQNPKKALYLNQIVTDAYNESGDSGCVILNQSNEILGLFFAGGNKTSVFTDIKIILKKLNVDLFLGF